MPSLFPLFDPESRTLYDGTSVEACTFCRKAIKETDACLRHYTSLLSRPQGFYECPFGFTTRSFYFEGKLLMLTGTVGFPRFGSEAERKRAKDNPNVRVARDSLEKMISFVREVEVLRANTVQEAAEIFPQAFHELRKLNGAIIQHAEKQLRAEGDSATLTTIKSAAELMRNNFDILEALSNIEGMKALPSNDTINVYDLVYKMKCVLQQRAEARQMHISLTGMGSRAMIRGSRKSFPTVPAVLLENAIKYGEARTTINIGLTVSGKTAILTFENKSQHPIDPNRCFDRGTRYSPNAAEGGGLGLFLAKEIVLAHRGAIRCETDGATVRMIVELPLEKVV